MKMRKVPLALSFVLLFSIIGCGDGGGDDTDADGDEDVVEEELPPCDPFPAAETGDDGADVSGPVPAGEARAGKINEAGDVPTGRKSQAEVGDFLLKNSKVGFVIENTAGGTGYRSDGYQPYGGEIVFADRWGEDGESGHNNFGESFYGLGLQMVDPDTVTVMNDGTDGEDAVVRVTGRLAPLPLLDVGMGELLDPRPFNGEMIIDYVLAPDDEHLQIWFTIRNPNNRLSRLHLALLGIIMGDGLYTFVREGGFDDSTFSGKHILYGYVGRNISYGFLNGSGEELEFVLEESNVLATTLASYWEIEACGEWQVHAIDMVVAGGGAEALLKAVRNVRGEEEPARLEGTVTVDGGGPAAGARVHVLQDDDTYVTSAICGIDGSYGIGLEPGDYKVTVVLEGHAISGPDDVTMGDSDQTHDIELAEPGTFAYTLVDGDSDPIPAKVMIFPTSFSESLPRSFGEDRHPDGAYQYVFDHDGAGEVTLPVGTYDVVASRGYWYEFEEQEIEITAGNNTNAEFVLLEVVDRTGFLCADFHQHSIYSPDVWTVPEAAVSANVTEGLDIIPSTDHDWITWYQYLVEDMGLEAIVKAFPGSEVTTYEYGHFNAYPLTQRPDERNEGSVDHYYKEPGELFTEILADPAGPMLQLNHPRSTGIGGYFSSVRLDSAACEAGKPEMWSDLWNVVEGFNGDDFRRNELAEGGTGTVDDWFNLLKCGNMFAVTATSDSHNPEDSEFGYGRSCLDVGFDDPSILTGEDVTDAMKALKVLVSGGAFITVDIDGKGMGETVSAPGGEADITIVVQAAEWIGLDRMRIFVSGAEMDTITLDESTADPENPVIRFSGTVQIDTGGGDGFVVVEVEGDETMDPVVNDQRPFAVTNPIFLDADGDGEFTP
ncbi:MAG: CehA/McbA family metallohydrolase [Pseudomonadota bacterium]